MPAGFRGSRRGPPAPAGPLRIVSVGAVAPPVLERAAAVSREVLGFTPLPFESGLDPAPFLDAARRQYRADTLITALRTATPAGQRVLGLTAVDLCLPVLTYVYGFADLGGTAALVSTQRLNPRFDGDPDDAGLMLERLEKEVLHELGHVRHLVHCRDRRCVMASSHDAGEIDIKEPAFCDECWGGLR